MACLRAACALSPVPRDGAGLATALSGWPRWLSSSASASGGDAPVASTSQPDAVTVPLGKNTVILEGAVPLWPAQPASQVQARAKYRPWDPTRTLVRKAAYPKRMGFLMQVRA
jgi:hypothetical protein